MRRMLLGRFETVDQYCQQLKINPGEVRSLFDDILINVTEFFRDPEVFETLETKIVPQLIKEEDGKVKRRIRVWIGLLQRRRSVLDCDGPAGGAGRGDHRDDGADLRDRRK